MSDVIQHAVVALAAAGAATFMLWRVVAALRRPSAPASCDHCAVSTIAAAQERREPRV